MKRWALLLLVAAGSCRQVAGIDDRSAEGPLCGNPASGEDACSTCVAGTCCQQSLACSREPECSALFGCLNACNGANDCRSACRTAQPKGFTETAAALLACQAKTCAAACGTNACGGWVFASGVCASCAESSCCSQATACAADAECTALAFCARSCGDDLTCASQCGERHPSGWGTEQKLAACVQNKCEVVCGGRGWDCVGSVEWPPGFGKVKWNLHLNDFVKAQPLAGVTCKACRRTDPECVDPIAVPSVTDAKGEVILEVPANFDGFADVSGPGLYPVLLFPFRPLTKDTGQQAQLLTTAAFPVMAALVGQPDPERGHLSLNINDCSGAPAANVSFEATGADASTLPFYFVENLPSKTATETDPTGRGGFGNLLPGVVTVRAKVDAIGLKVSEATVLIRKGTFTYKPLEPSP